MLTQPFIFAWIQLEYPSGWLRWALFAAFAVAAALTVGLGMRSLAGLGAVRKWVAIGVRLLVLLLIFLILGNIKWTREHKDLSVMVLRDISDSTAQVRDYPAGDKSLQGAIDDYLQKTAASEDKPAKDRMGVISFNTNALIESMPNTHLALDTRPVREGGSGTDPASAIQLALASMGNDTMRRIVLFWDGNATTGKLDEAIAAAVAQKVPIDVVPLKYNIENETLVERFVAPTWKRENEPFTIDVILKSVNPTPVRGKLTVLHQGEAMDLDPNTDGIQATRAVTLQPGLNVQRVRVGPLREAGVHQFRALFEPENTGTTGVEANVSPLKSGDTLLSNNKADAFTFVQGQGRVLLIDGYSGPDYPNGAGVLRQALSSEKINLDAERTKVEDFPNDLMTLQNYDAVVLCNVRLGQDGLSLDQDKMLASAVQNMGMGLVMIGGPDAFGAGGWQSSEVEKVLPVNMEIQAQRQIPKGALVLIMHSCEMPDGNYWGEQCAIKAVQALSPYDEVGVISYGWQGKGGSQWDFPLQARGDGAQAIASIKKMQLGDMMSFEDCMNVALNGSGNNPGLLQSTAKQKHVIIISDGDPSGPSQGLVNQYLAAKVTVSTVAVFPHMANIPPTMQNIAKDLKGTAYGPINNNPSQLPQIFIKEATIVRRNLIFEDEKGISVNLDPNSASEVSKGIADWPPIRGLVLTSRKSNPTIEVPLTAGKNNDPLLAHWQIGLGRSVAFAGDVTAKWSPQWVGAEFFSKFWAQAVRYVSRPPMSTDVDVQTTVEGTRMRIAVEALNKEGGHRNFLRLRGVYVDPDFQKHEVTLVQTGPGLYEAEVDLAAGANKGGKTEGNYVVRLSYTDPDGGQGSLVSGVAVNQSPELRDLTSNEARVAEVARRTGGRVIKRAIDASGVHPQAADLFARQWTDEEGKPARLPRTASPLPVWDLLIPWLLGLILVDVATRRIAWDWQSTKRMAQKAGQLVRDFTTTRKVETRETLDALKKVRDEVAETKFRPTEEAQQEAATSVRGTPAPRPDAATKFEAKGVEGDITQVVGGATAKPVPPPPKKIEPKGGDHTSSLLEAKRRAQQKMKEREQDS